MVRRDLVHDVRLLFLNQDYFLQSSSSVKKTCRPHCFLKNRQTKKKNLSLKKMFVKDSKGRQKQNSDKHQWPNVRSPTPKAMSAQTTRLMFPGEIL